jgi:hypothetical protein
MIANMHVGDITSIWDLNKDGRVRIGVGQCKDQSLVSIYGISGVENCIVVTIISMVEALNIKDFFAQLQLHNIVHPW